MQDAASKNTEDKKKTLKGHIQYLPYLDGAMTGLR